MFAGLGLRRPWAVGVVGLPVRGKTGLGCALRGTNPRPRLQKEINKMRAKNWKFICTAAATFVSSAAMAQDCTTAPAAFVGLNPYDTSASVVDLAMPAGGGCASAHTIFKVEFFTFTAAVDGVHTFSLCGGAAYDTRIAVLADCDPAFGVLGCNDDACGLQSQATANLLAGMTYKVVVGGYGATNQGVGTLTISEPAGGGGGGGGACDSPTALTIGDNTFANTASGEILDLTGICDMQFTDELNNTNYYSFTPKVAGNYSISTCNQATFDTKIAVLTSCDAFSAIACNDDGTGCTGFTSLIPSVPMDAGVTYIIAVGGYSATTPVGGGTITIAEAGSGGGGGSADCNKAPEAFEGANNFSTIGATGVLALDGLCDMGPFGDDAAYNVIYYRFTPTVDGIWTVSTCNSVDYDSRLAVLGSCDPFSVIACNDDFGACAGFSSQLEFTGTTGVEVIIAVGGFDPASAGSGILNIIAGSLVVPCGDPKSGDCCLATGTPSCNDEVCCDAVCAADAFCCETEWDQVCADQAAFLCASCGAGSCPIAAGTVNELELCGEDFNGGCNGGGFDFVSVGDTIAGTFWADADFRDTDWYLLDLAESTEVTLTISANMPCFAAFVDTGCAGIIGSVTTGNCGGQTTQCFPAGQYYIVALPAVFAGFPCGFEFGNEYSLEVSGIPCKANPPANDSCFTATEAFEGANFFDNQFANTDYDIPTCGFGGTAFTKDVYFFFNPILTGGYRFETCSGLAPFDTGIEIWSDCPDFGGTLLACNDDGTGCANFASQVDFELVAGTTYYIRVGGWGGATGATDLVIGFLGDLPGCGDPGTGDCCVATGTPFCEDADCCSIVCAADAFCCDTEWDQICADAAALSCANCGGSSEPPVNDECAAALPIFIGDTAVSNANATGTTPACDKFGNPNIFNDVWYAYEAAGDGLCTVSMCNAPAWDTKIAVFDACGGNLIACNDDTCGLVSEVSFTPVCGTTYSISIGSYGATGFGSGTVTITQDGKCGGGNNCPADLNLDGQVNAADLATLLDAWGTAGADLNGDGSTNAADLATLLDAWGTCP